MRIKILLKQIKKELINNNLTIAVCESASGGNLSALLTSIDGSSNYFKGGVISYWTEIKNNIVGVKKTTTDKYGVISYETAYEMAENILKKFNVDLAISITGNSSKNNLQEDKSSCLYYVGFASKDGIDVKQIRTKVRSRKKNQIAIAKKALLILYKKLLERN